MSDKIQLQHFVRGFILRISVFVATYVPLESSIDMQSEIKPISIQVIWEDNGKNIPDFI